MTLFLKLKNNENFFIKSFDEVKTSQIYDEIQEIIGINVKVPLPKRLPKFLKKLIWTHNNLERLSIKFPKTLEVLNLSDNHLSRFPKIPSSVKIVNF